MDGRLAFTKAELLHWADAAVGGALLCAVADAVLLFSARQAGLGAIIFLVALHLAAAGPVAIAFVGAGAGVGRAARSFDGALGRRFRTAITGVTMILLVWPALTAVRNLRYRIPRIPWGLPVAMGCCALVLTLTWLAGKRVRSPTSWLFGALASFALMHVVSETLRLAAKLYHVEAVLSLQLLLAGAVASIVLALAVAAIVAPEPGTPIVWKAAAGLVGVAVVVCEVRVDRMLNPTSRALACLCAYVFFGLAATALSRYGKLIHRVISVGAGVAVVAYLVFAFPLPSTIPWALASDTMFARVLLTTTGVMRPSAERFVASLHRQAAGGSAPRTPAAAAPAPFALPQGTPPLSILLVTVDALRYDRLGYSGRARPGLTPRLDELAARAQRFHRAYPQGAWTSLSIPSMLWSRHPKDLRFVAAYEDAWMDVLLEPEGGELPAMVTRRFQAPLGEPSRSAAEVLSEHGIATIAVANDGFTNYFNPKLGFSRGFQKVVYPKQACPPASPLKRVQIPGLNDPCTVRLAVDELRAVGSGRFFLWVHLFGAHGPHAPRAQQPPFSGYDAQVHEVDHDLGELLSAISALGRERDTIVVVTGDHGEEIDAAGHGIHGVSLHEEGLHVPLLVAIPGVPGRDIDAPEVGLVDIVPTVLELAGVPAPGTMEGRSLTPLLGSEKPPSWPPVFVQCWRSEMDGTRNLDLIGAIQGGAKVVLDLRSWTFAYADAADAGETNLFSTATPDRETFDRLALRLVDWYPVP